MIITSIILAAVIVVHIIRWWMREDMLMTEERSLPRGWREICRDDYRKAKEEGHIRKLSE